MLKALNKTSFYLKALRLCLAVFCLVFSARFSNAQTAEAKPEALTMSPHASIGSIAFSWNDPVSMSAFLRNGHLWVVFDQKQNLDIPALSKDVAELASNLIQIPHSKATLLRLTPKPGVNVSLRKEGLLWIVDLSRQKIDTYSAFLDISMQTNSVNEPYLFIPTASSGNIVSFIDPDIGDSVVVATTNEVNLRIPSSYSYPDVEFLEALQGAVIIPNAGDLVFSRGNTGITINSASRGLNISPNIELLKRREMLSQTSDEISTLSREIPGELLNQKFLDVIDRLKQNILSAGTPEQENEANFELARYYIGKGLGAEALAQLKELEKRKSPITMMEKFHGLKGVAYFLNRQYFEASEEFSYEELATYNEAIFWKALSDSALEAKPENNAIIQSFIFVIKGYPDRIKEKVAVVGVEAALNALDDMTAQNFIDILKSTNTNNKNQPLIDYYTAEKLFLQGYPRNALKEYKKAAASKDRKYSSMARFKAAMLEYNINLPVAASIAELEKVRYAWGEKKFKITLLENLSDLYKSNGDYYNALKSMNVALMLTSNEKAAEINEKMVGLFEDIYLYNQADAMSPLKSISLYRDFEWLAPQSKKYAQIAQNLADRLVAVDLLERASMVLTNQLKSGKLNPVEKARIGARMALIDLFLGLNKEALDVLDETESKNLPETTTAHRKIIRAKALSNLDHTDEALALIENDYSKNAVLLKSEIYWTAERWADVADNIKYLIDKPEPGKPLSLEQVNLILDWITALKKSGRETVIVRIRNKFMPYFENTKYQSTFNILTNKLESDKIDMNDINQSIDEIKSFSQFSKIYTDSLKFDKKI